MTRDELERSHFPSAGEDLEWLGSLEAEQAFDRAYRLAYADSDFLLRDELRAVRLQLELLKPELFQKDQGIRSTVVIFGSARIPDPESAETQLADAERAAAAAPEDAEAVSRLARVRSLASKVRYYDEARKLARIITEHAQCDEGIDLVVTTGGGPGIMEAANRGAREIGGRTIGLNIVLPLEQRPNPYITPELCFHFHYFAIRKMHFLMRAKALVAFPGGYGTLDELFETLTLVQTRKIKPMPVLLFGREYWERIIDFEGMVAEGVISPGDRELIRYVERAEDAWAEIRDFYRFESRARK